MTWIPFADGNRWSRAGTSADQGHELGRRVRAAHSRPILRRWPLLSDPLDRPLLSVGGPPRTVATGTPRARPAGTMLADRGGDGHKLNWRVRLVLGDYLPRWQASKRRPGGRLMAPVMARLWRAGACCGSPNGRAGLVRGSH